MSNRKKGPITAGELLAQLNKDPEFVRRAQEREAMRQNLEAQLLTDEQPLVAELIKAGCRVKSVWDLVNTKAKYPDAIPVLAKHLRRPYHPRNIEGIARALTVPEARGVPAREILDELKRRTEKAPDQVRFALANALAMVGDTSMRADLEAMMADPRYADLQNVLKLVMAKIAVRAVRA